MELKNRWQDRLTASLLTLLFFGFLALRFDFCYDLNDDVLIKDILSGVYSGAPDGHTMQLLYPLGAVLSFLYRLLPVPVFGLFLIACQGVSVWVILRRTAGMCRGLVGRIALPAAESLFLLAAFGGHMLFLQYTVTSGLLAGAAVFWLLTGTQEEEPFLAGRFIGQNVPALVLYWLAFCLRPEMGLLLLPLAGTAGLCLWAQRPPFFSRENLAAYAGLFLILAAGMGLFWGMDGLAYRSQDWKEFRRFFNARTELYDYQLDLINNYGENEEIYRALDIAPQQQKLLETYNFGADDSIDADWMEGLQDAAAGREGGGIFRQTVGEALWSLRHRFLSSGDFPLNLAVLTAFVCLLGLGARRGSRGLLWQAPLCLAAGGVSWMFLLLRNRPETRVVDPLYLAQFLVFWGLLLKCLADRAKGREGRESLWDGCQKAIPGAVAVFLAVLAALRLPFTLTEMEGEFWRREETNRIQQEVMAYCSARPETLFLEDVYSTVAYSETIWVDRDKPFNYDLLGGWLVKSPLSQKKLSAFGFSGMEEAVRSTEGVLLLSDAESGMEWLEDYFAFRQEAVSLVLEDTIGGRVEVWRVTAEGE